MDARTCTSVQKMEPNCPDEGKTAPSPPLVNSGNFVQATPITVQDYLPAAIPMDKPDGNLPLRMHPNYERLVELACTSHERGRAPAGISERDIIHARLYSHAFR